MRQDDIKGARIMPEETTLATLASEVEEAREALLDVAQSDPDRLWTVDELVNGLRHQWRGTVVMIALDQLITDEALEADPRWRVRVCK